MSEDLILRAQEWLESQHDAMLDDLRGLLRIPSLEADAEPNAPFGMECRRALDFMLELSKKYGLTTKDLDGYAGWVEYGSGDKMIMSLGHVDVVPVGPGWKHEPFGAELDNGYVYARGACDDKGPTMAAFYAALAIKEIYGDPGVRVRHVFGCNEESGFKCVEHYMKTEEVPTVGVAPDAGWPLIHGEKGISDLVLDVPLPKGELELLEIEGGQRPNIVIDSCGARVRVNTSVRAHIEEKMADSWDRNLELSWNDDVLEITANGKAAHGSTPYFGDNAAIRILRFLMEIAPLSQEREFDRLFEAAHIGGNGVGIAGSDEPSGPLTCNLGIIQTVGGCARLTLNIRYPVTWNGADLRAKAEKAIPSDWRIHSFSDSKPLYFPLDHPLVRTICAAYERETGERKDPGVMGGGTYARAVPNCVAIGTGWAGDGPAHETDERLKVEHLNKMARIYVRIFAGMIEVAQNS
jgi:succinyl-diaminopimelate desuccinylase